MNCQTIIYNEEQGQIEDFTKTEIDLPQNFLLHYFTFKPMFYSSSIESEMKKFYNSLSEKDKRRYAAFLGSKIGMGRN